MKKEDYFRLNALKREVYRADSKRRRVYEGDPTDERLWQKHAAPCPGAALANASSRLLAPAARCRAPARAT